MTLEHETLDTVACEFDKRPKDAPSFFDLADAIRGVRRDTGWLVVEFDAAAVDQVEALVAAERACCPGIGWELTRGPAVRLRVVATEPQLDIVEGFLGRG